MRGFQSITADVTTAFGVFAYSYLWLNLLEVQSILDVGSSCSVHLGRCRRLESYRSALRRGFDIRYVCADLETNFMLKALLIKLYNSLFY